MMAVAVGPGPDELTFEAPMELFAGDYTYGYLFQGPSYDVHPDGRFLMIERDVASSSIRVILNWFEELKERVPTGR